MTKKLNKIEKLIAELCPEGVEFMKLGEVTDEYRIRNADQKIADVRSVTNTEGLVATEDFFTNARTSKDTSNYKVAEKDMLVYNPSRINVGSIARHTGKKKIIVSPMYVVVDIYRKKLNPKYLDIFLKSFAFKFQMNSKVEIGARFRLPYESFAKIKIPIPPIEIQKEIVKILDNFTELEAELEAELETRKKQYEYYRDEMLAFEDDEVERKELGSVVNINTGQKPLEILELATEFDYINAGTTRSGYCLNKNCDGDVVTTPSRGQGGIGYIGYQCKPFWLGPLCYKLEAKRQAGLVNKFLFYYLQSNNRIILTLKKEGGVPAVNKIDLEKIKISIPYKNGDPDLEKQKEIVSVLDKFDAMVNDISIGLPAEIKARCQQYEYYREKLLTFKEMEK